MAIEHYLSMYARHFKNLFMFTDFLPRFLENCCEPYLRLSHLQHVVCYYSLTSPGNTLVLHFCIKQYVADHDQWILNKIELESHLVLQ